MKLDLRRSGIVALLILAAARPALAADYSWNSATTGVSAGTWSGTANWSPASPVGGPSATDNIVTPVQFGAININVANAQVTDWTYSSGSSQDIFANGGVGATLTISGNLTKSGAGVLTFRNSGSNLTMSVGDIFVSSGTLSMGARIGTTLSSFSADSADISGGALGLNVTGAAAISGSVSLSGSGAFYLAQLQNATGRSVSVGALSSASTTAVVAANDFSSSRSEASLILTATSGTATYAGIISNGGTASGNPSMLAIQKNGGGTQIFSGNGNIYNGGTTVNAGTLLVNNTSGSGTGTGIVTVNGGMFGGTGIVAPTGANGIGVAAGGYIAPGASIGTLTFNMGGTTGIVDLLAGGDFRFELGTANDLIGSIAPGSSDLLVISGASAGDVVFAADTTIDLLGTATDEGYYKLFDTSAGTATWTGLTLGAATTGGNFITGGLTATNFGGGYSGSLILADGSAGTSAGDIYLLVVPEPSTGILLAIAGTALLALRRFRRARI